MNYSKDIIIAFDIGNVLCHVDFNPLMEEWEKQQVGSREECYKFLEIIQASQDTGVLNFESAVNLFLSGKSLKFDANKLIEAWCQCVYPNERMLDFLLELKGKGSKIALLSNIGREHDKLLNKKYSSMLDDCILHFSCHWGIRKPSPLFFKTFLEENKDFEYCIYLDDRPENVQMSRKYNFDGKKFDLDELIKTNKLEQELDKIVEQLKNDYCLYDGGWDG